MKEQYKVIMKSLKSEPMKNTLKAYYTEGKKTPTSVISRAAKISGVSVNVARKNLTAGHGCVFEGSRTEGFELVAINIPANYGFGGRRDKPFKKRTDPIYSPSPIDQLLNGVFA